MGILLTNEDFWLWVFSTFHFYIAQPVTPFVDGIEQHSVGTFTKCGITRITRYVGLARHGVSVAAVGTVDTKPFVG